MLPQKAHYRESVPLKKRLQGLKPQCSQELLLRLKCSKARLCRKEHSLKTAIPYMNTTENISKSSFIISVTYSEIRVVNLKYPFLGYPYIQDRSSA